MTKNFFEYPKVSVIIATYKRTDSLEKAINSVKNQKYKNIELIVVDDNIDNCDSFEIVSRFSNLKYHHEGINKGGAAARNIGIRMATGDFVAFLDDDDLYFDDKIGFLVEKSFVYPLYDAYFGATVKSNENSESSVEESKLGICEIKEIKCLKKIHTNSSIIRRNVFNNIAFFEGLEKYQDTQLHIELVEKFKILYFSRPVSCWNVDSNSGRITSLNSYKDYVKSFRSFRKMIKYLEKKNISKGTLNNLKVSLARHALGLAYKYFRSKVNI